MSRARGPKKQKALSVHIYCTWEKTRGPAGHSVTERAGASGFVFECVCVGVRGYVLERKLNLVCVFLAVVYVLTTRLLCNAKNETLEV